MSVLILCEAAGRPSSSFLQTHKTTPSAEVDEKGSSFAGLHCSAVDCLLVEAGGEGEGKGECGLITV